MPAQLRSGFDRLKAFFLGFSAAQRTIAIILAAVLALGGVALSSWLGQAQMSPLFSGLSSSDASAVVDVLKTDGVSYQLTDGGDTILVPSDKVYAERLAAAAKNLPASSSSNSGYSLLDKLSVTSSDFQNTETYKRAIEGELENTIDAMDGVKLAKVQLAIPAASVFTDSTQAPTASVFLQLDAGTTLTSAQISAVTHLIASSVTNMTTAGVSVVDSKGDVLSANGLTTGAADGSTTVAQTKASIQKILDSIVGAGNSTVAVTADVSADSSTVVKQSYTPIPGATPTSSTQSSETYSSGSGGSAAGSIGASTGSVPSSVATGGGNYNSSSSSGQTPVDSTTENTTVPAGQLSRLSISVAVDKNAAKGVTLAELQSLVGASAGYNQARGDTLAVQLVTFSATNAAAAKTALAQAEKDQANQQTSELIHDAVIGLIVLLIVLVIVGGLVMLSKRKPGSREPVDLAELELHEMIEESAAKQPVAPVAPRPAAEPMPAPASAANRAAELDRSVKNDPQKAAETLRTLMGERR